MTWNDFIMVAIVLLLCAIAFGLYRINETLESKYSGLRELLGENQKVSEKILFQLNSRSSLGLEHYSENALDTEVREIKSDLRFWIKSCQRLHSPDFLKIEKEKIASNKI